MKPFSLTDPSIGFPYVGDTIPTWLLVVVTLAAPAAIILVTILVLLPGPTIGSNVSRNKIWTVKLWELHTGLAGLCLACALALLVTDGMKQLLGKPRPNVLSRCMPDTANAEQYAVKDLDGNVVSGELLVTAAICLQTDKSMLDEAFRAFNSGHSSCECHFLSLNCLCVNLMLTERQSPRLVLPTLPYLYVPNSLSPSLSQLHAHPSRPGKAHAHIMKASQVVPQVLLYSHLI
jgi:hypothetical protein